ncbi:MAG: hypothetical protein R3F61_15710 [Myxococcota bacterium]
MLRFAPICLFALACTGGDTSDLEIVGSFSDNFGGAHTITADTWTMDGAGVFHITTFDNDADFLIAQNDANNEYNPDLWSRMDWFDAGTTLWFCQSAFDAATEADALATAAADPSDPATTGCGGFSWTQLTATP